MAEIQQAVIGWGPTSNGLGVLGNSAGWPLVDGVAWLPDAARAFLPRGSDAEVMRGTEPPCGLEARPTEHGTLLVSKVYLGRVGRPGTFAAHCLLDPTGRQCAQDLLDLARDGALLRREEQPVGGVLEVLGLPARRTRPDPEGVRQDLLAALLGHLTDRTPLLLRATDRAAGVETLSALAHALPRKVAADLWWSTFVAQPDDPAETGGPGVGLLVAPFSGAGSGTVADRYGTDRPGDGHGLRTGDPYGTRAADPYGPRAGDPYGARAGEAYATDRPAAAFGAAGAEPDRRPAAAPAGPIDLDGGPIDVSDRAAALARTYLEHPGQCAEADGVDTFVARLDALVIDPAVPLDGRALDLLAEEVGPSVFARLLTGPYAMTRLAEVVRARRRLPYRTLWTAVPVLTDQMYAWFAPVQGDPAMQARAQRVICATMDSRNLLRLVARPLSHDAADYRPVVADRKLASALASLDGSREGSLEAYEWRVLTEEWGPVVHAAVVAWLAGWTDAPEDLARFADDRPAFVAGLQAALRAVAADPGADPADVRARLAAWRGLPAEDWADLLAECPAATSGASLAALGRLDPRDVRQVLRRSWPRLAAQAGIPPVVADELRVRGLGGF